MTARTLCSAAPSVSSARRYARRVTRQARHYVLWALALVGSTALLAGTAVYAAETPADSSGSSSSGSTTVYRWVDADGVVHYSDHPQPGAQRLQIRPAPTFHEPPVPAVSAPPVTVTMVPPPQCPYGYYDYPPYDCAPDGYYGPEWFVNGAFIGAGPWFHGRQNFRGYVNSHYDPQHGYHGSLPRRGQRPDPHRPAGHTAQFHGDEARDGHGNVLPPSLHTLGAVNP